MFKPINANILVELMKGEEKTAGGLILPETSRETKNEGVVLAVGDGIKDKDGVFQPLPVSVGDVIVFNKTAGFELEQDEKKCKVISIKDVYGKVVE